MDAVLIGESYFFGWARFMRTSILVCMSLLLSTSGHTECPTADLSGDCKVGLADLAIMAGQWEGEPNMPVLYDMASQWMTEGVLDLVWVSINDSGAGMKDENGNPISHGGFTGEMSKYETTNAQYCQFLNAALASGDVNVDGSWVMGSAGSNSGADFVGRLYYYLAGLGLTVDGATNGGASRIYYNGSSFTVNSGFNNHPVSHVSWYGSTAFCNYYGYELPTEWEWQAVADHEGVFIYGCGTSINNSIANYYGSNHPDGTTVVGSFGTYGYGMADMAGNVYEWTSSIYSGSRRALRGGSWSGNDDYCTVSNRDVRESGQIWGYFIGFRVCR